MSNHSEEVPGGTLDRETLKTFFAVSGEPGSFGKFLIRLVMA
jgi:hypothetical protein